MKLQSLKIVLEPVLLSKNMADLVSSTVNSLSATNNHPQDFPEAEKNAARLIKITQIMPFLSVKTESEYKRCLFNS